MGLWVMLLLCFHLGNAPWTEVACVSLPPPSNVSISSFNMEHTLRFLPGPETPSGARYAVQVLRLSKNSWKEVASCSQLAAGQTCNLTRAFKDPFSSYRARVQAFTSNHTSPWTMSGRFQPLTHTVLGPPNVSVSGCGNCLVLQLREASAGHFQLFRDLHGLLKIHVQRTRDGAQFSFSQSFQEEITLRYLQPGVQYCVTISAETRFRSTAAPGPPQCAFTSPPQGPSSVYVLCGLLGALSALGLLVTGLVVRDGRLTFRFLRRRPPRALPFFLRLSDQVSVTQVRKNDSSTCLLTDLSPGQSQRSSCGGGLKPGDAEGDEDPL